MSPVMNVLHLICKHMRFKKNKNEMCMAMTRPLVYQCSRDSTTPSPCLRMKLCMGSVPDAKRTVRTKQLLQMHTEVRARARWQVIGLSSESGLGCAACFLWVLAVSAFVAVCVFALMRPQMRTGQRRPRKGPGGPSARVLPAWFHSMPRDVLVCAFPGR